VISLISQLSPQKGHIHIINAAEIITKDYQNVRFLFAGGAFGQNNNKVYLEEQIAKKGLAQWFTFTGFREDVEDVLGASDITVLPSVKGEGLPRAILESMAMQRPVIASDIAGITEIIDDGIDGYVVAPGDESAIVDRLSRLIRHERRREQMGLAARDKIVKNFELTSMVKKYQSVYEDLVGSTRQG
jgi:glycosyltransferase involved in cell wall biosynthesis